MAKVVSYQGKRYPSIRNLCVELKIPEQRVYYLINGGCTVEEAVRVITESKEKWKISKTQYTYEGRTFSSLREICVEYGFSLPTLRRCLAAGQSLEEIINYYKARYYRLTPVEYDGVLYRSNSALLRAYNITNKTFRDYSKKGYTIEEIIENKHKIKYRDEDLTFNSKTEVAEYLHTTVNWLVEREREGYTIEYILENKEQFFEEIHGEWFLSHLAACRYFNVPHDLVKEEMKVQGVSVEEAIDRIHRLCNNGRYSHIKYNEKSFHSLEELCAEYKYSEKNIKRYISKGLSLLDAIDREALYGIHAESR